MSSMQLALGQVGRWTLLFLEAIGSMSRFVGRAMGVLLQGRVFWAEVVQAMVRAGLHTAGIIALVLFFIGANVALSGDAIFRSFGGQDLIGIYVGLSCVIGLAPLIVGAMLASKPGTEIAATIASMRVKQQIDALEVMAVDPFWYLVVPRLVAFMLVAAPLTVMAYVVSVGGGYVAATAQLGANPATFMQDVVRFLHFSDLWKGIVRAEVFALVSVFIAAYFGYHSRPGPAGVSRAINLSVVLSCTTIVVVNYVLTELMY